MKKIIYIISIFLVLGLIGGLIYFYFLPIGEQKITEEFGGELPSGEGAPTIQVQGSGEIKSFSEDKVLSPTFSADGQKILYFDKNTGRIFQINIDGSGAEQISQLEVPNLVKAVWSPDKTKVIEAFSGSEGPAKILYDIVSQKTIPLNGNISDFAFGPKDNEFIYYLDGQIYLSNSDYTKVNSLYSVKIPNPILRWLGNIIYIATPASDYAEGVIFSLDPAEAILLKVVSGPALLANYSADGSRIISSSKNVLSVTSAVKTLANKCAFSNISQDIYCAVPKSMPEKFIIDDYYQGLIEFNDDFWKINTVSGDKTLIKSSDENFDAQNLVVSPNEDYLIFVNKKDGKLYSLKI